MRVDESKVNACYRQMIMDGISDHNVHYAVGKKCFGSIVTKIGYHSPMGEGDQHYCDIYFDDCSVVRMFRPDFVTFESVEGEGK